MTYYEELIISSGGNRGFSIIGVLNEFSKNYPINKIKYFTGCSVGSLILLFLILGYNINELNNILFDLDFSLFQELKLINLVEKCGFDEGTKINNFLKAIIINKNYNYNITFKELFEKTNKILTIVVTNITKGLSEYHNYINTPDMQVFLSIRMSINIPIIFSPILYNKNYYIDGGLLDPFPYKYNKHINKSKKCGLWLSEKYEFDFIKNNNFIFINDISNSLNYIINLLKIMHVNYIKKNYEKIPNNVIYLDFNIDLCQSSFATNLEDKIKMLNIGINKCKLFFFKIYKRNRKKYLSRKYFNIWNNKIKK